MKAYQDLEDMGLYHPQTQIHDHCRARIVGPLQIRSKYSVSMSSFANRIASLKHEATERIASAQTYLFEVRKPRIRCQYRVTDQASRSWEQCCAAGLRHLRQI